MAVLLFVLTQIGILGGDTSVQQGIFLAAMAMVIYTPLAYMTDQLGLQHEPGEIAAAEEA